MGAGTMEGLGVEYFFVGVGGITFLSISYSLTLKVVVAD